MCHDGENDALGWLRHVSKASPILAEERPVFGVFIVSPGRCGPPDSSLSPKAEVKISGELFGCVEGGYESLDARHQCV